MMTDIYNEHSSQITCTRLINVNRNGWLYLASIPKDWSLMLVVFSVFCDWF